MSYRSNCIDCGKPIRSRATRCKPCFHVSTRQEFGDEWLAKRTERVGECLIWKRGKNHAGYGTTMHWAFPGEQLVTRMVVRHYHLGGAPIPDGDEASHLCGNPSCVRPEHLICEDHRRNVWRSERVGGFAKRDHCSAGHPYTVENTYLDSRGYRHCRACRNASGRAGYLRRKAEGRSYYVKVAARRERVGTNPA